MKYAFWKYPVHFLAYGFGTGLAPFAPGTFGSLIGVALFWFMAPLGAGTYAGIVIVLFVAGIFICGQTARDFGELDPGFIVFDEVVGFMVAMYLMPKEWRWIAAGFIIYRIFDIWKPIPIHIVEEKLTLGTAIMADDVIAGIYTLLVLQIARLALEKIAH
jgi:phosphatidylglycerophosphatase A